jgi:D-alanyl-D-alanine carboxypeptidase
MQKSMKKRIKHRLVYALLMSWTVLGIVGIVAVTHWMLLSVEAEQEQVYGNAAVEEETPDLPVSIEDRTDTADTVTAAAAAQMEEERALCRQIYENNPEVLVLVNKEYELDPDYDPQLRSICNGRLEASDRMYEDLSDMLDAARADGETVWIASAYRSRERQQELVDEDVYALEKNGEDYEDALEETYRATMPAGHSEHETGLALDILCSNNYNLDESQADEPGNKWLVQHCQEYGFILRYPADKADITGIDYEPWHFRYVGKEAAEYMTEHGLALEEFTEFLQDE